MSRQYPKLGEYGLSSDEDGDGEEEEEAEGAWEGWFGAHRSNQESVRSSPSRHNRSQRWKRKEQTVHNKCNSHTSDSVSLADFDKEYADYDDDKHIKRGYGHELASSKRGTLSGGGGAEWLGSIVQWLVMTSKWKVALVGCLLGLSCAFVHQSYVWFLSDGTTDNLLLCSSTSGQKPCLTPPQLKLAYLMADPVRGQVRRRAGQFECGYRNVLSRDLRLEELESILPSEYSLESEEVMNMLTLIQHNPQWGIRWLDEDKNPVSANSFKYPTASHYLSSSQPHHGLLCWLRLTVGAVWDQLKMVFIIVLCVVVVAAAVRWYVHTKENEMRSIYLMVERIIDILKQHHENCQRDSNLLPYLAIIHVRDMLIPPSERKRSAKIWDKACVWLSQHESRVRVETQRISGEDFQVWRWIQVNPPATEIPWPAKYGGGAVSMAMGGARGGGEVGEDMTDGVKSQKGDWLGTAFEDYPPGVVVKVAPHAGSPSQFIRLKNMFEATRYMDDDMAREIENSVLERCSPHGDVVHVYIDRRSTFGCVYLKMDSLKSALGAYKALHGGWYRGKLVTAKYIPDSKYYKWFPNAAFAKTPLSPSPSSSSS